jgi:hypothetical protein
VSAQPGPQVGFVAQQRRRQVLVTPQLDVRCHLGRRRPDLARRGLPEALVAEGVVEVPVAVDDPTDGLAEGGEVVEELVRLAQVGAGVEDQE